MSLISTAARDLIVEQEVSSKDLYIKRYQRPTWPEGASGATVGIGYDCGYSHADGIQADWNNRIPQPMIDVLKSFAGATGEHAHSLVRTAEAGTVIVPWDAAIGEFDEVETPRWLAKCAKVFPNMDKLAPDAKGAIMSLGYNRGLALDGDRRREMLQIKIDLMNENYSLIPAQFRSMKRLWTNGLVRRRELEAQLFEKGLAQMAG